jgi:hypothetical protein
MVLVVSRTSGVLSNSLDEKTLLEKTCNLQYKNTVWSCAPLHRGSQFPPESKDHVDRESDGPVAGLRIIPTEALVFTYEGRSLSKAATMWFPRCPRFCHYPYTYSLQTNILTIMDARESQKRAAMPGSLWERGNFDQNEDFRSQFCGHTGDQDLDPGGC